VDLAEKEEAELKLTESYLPAAPTEEEMEAAIAKALAETGITSAQEDGGGDEGRASRALAGKTVDGKLLSEKVRARLV
jgi:uncharacterized protein YqeY